MVLFDWLKWLKLCSLELEVLSRIKSSPTLFLVLKAYNTNALVGVSIKGNTHCSTSENDHRVLSCTFRNVKLRNVELHTA